MRTSYLLLLAGLLIFSLSGWFLLWSLLPDWQISEYEFAVLGDSLRNIGGITAVLAASIAAWIAYRTNETRRFEAMKSNFKDRMQWAVTHLQSDDSVEKFYSLELIKSLSIDPYLDELDRVLVKQVIAEQKRQIESENSKLQAEIQNSRSFLGRLARRGK